MNISLTDYITVSSVIDAMQGTGSLARPCERDFRRLLWEQRAAHYEQRIAHYRVVTPVQRFDPAVRFNSIVNTVLDVINDDGTLWCKTNRGWKRVDDPERIANELCDSLCISVLASHVREAQRRVQHEPNTNRRRE